MSLDFLVPEPVADDRFAPVARSPMERLAREAGARFELRDGWCVAVAYDGPAANGDAAGWIDLSHLGKLEIQDAHDLPLGEARRDGDVWWLPTRPDRALVIGAPAAIRAARGGLSGDVLDVTTVFAALAIVGPRARDVIARFCALDLRDHVTPVHAVRPGSIARTPGLIVREAEDRFLLLFGWALGEHLWTVVADAATHLGGRPHA